MPNLAEVVKRYAAAYRAGQKLVSPVGDGGDDVLLAKLEECREARLLIPGHLEQARELASEATSAAERDFRLWQGEAVQRQVERAAECAEERLRFFDSLKTDADRAEAKDRGRDTLFWFRTFAWGYDPRHPLLKVQPFDPFEFQMRYLLWLDETVLRRRTSGVVEKSRDMGATVGALDWVAHKWLYVAGFSAFLTSATEDLVDSKKDLDTLFEKLRFQLRLLPSWMLPEGFNLSRDLPYMNISNPETQAMITGGAPTENVGRQRRATVVLADEFQAWPGGGFKQNTALSQTSPSVVKLGTPYGTLNQYYRDTHAAGANVFVMDWREHPFKSQAWYDSLPHGWGGSAMSAESIAQEIDRDYAASQPGRVWPQYSEPHTVITVSELRAYLGQRGVLLPDDGDGRARMPHTWALGRGNDRGATAGHRNAWLWCSTPKEGDPLGDSVFVFREWIAPLGSGAQAIVRQVRVFEARDKEGARADLFSYNSHEAEGERNTYRELGLNLHRWTTDYESGISDIGSRFELVDTDSSHPIRPQLMGRPRIYFVVADGQGELRVNASGVFTCAEAKDSGGLINLRRQVVRYHYPPEEEGKPVGMMRPQKIDDDCIDVLRAFATHKWPRRPYLTEAERKDLERPEGLRNSAIQRAMREPPQDDWGAGRVVASQMVWDSEQEHERERKRGRFAGFRPPRIPARPRGPWGRW